METITSLFSIIRSSLVSSKTRANSLFNVCLSDLSSQSRALPELKQCPSLIENLPKNYNASLPKSLNQAKTPTNQALQTQLV